MFNHSSGDPTPISEDLEVTEKIEKAGEELQIKVLGFKKGGGERRGNPL
ncbi:MAG: JAB domain-containing protein [Nanoarchaeota archaeon]